MSFIRALDLQYFRSYEQAAFDALEPGAIVLYGANGAGKTNILEAVSMLSPGRGLRGVKATEMQRHGAGESWTVSADIETRYGPVRAGTGLDAATGRRVVRINGAAAKGQNALADYLSCVWLTPQMDRLFTESAAGRRRFLDRLVFAFDAGHAGRMTRYENALAQRSKILREHARPNPGWLDGLERLLAETGVAIAAARVECAQKLQQACDTAPDREDNVFPRARLDLRGALEQLVVKAPALEVEKMHQDRLRQSRSEDSASGGAAAGPHRSDLAVTFAAKRMPAALCSTGEQKALLIGIVLAHSRLIAAERGSPPILLLDEVAAHLDEHRRAGLYALLAELGGQVWLTGTDRSLFDAMRTHKSAFFEIETAIFNRPYGRAQCKIFQHGDHSDHSDFIHGIAVVAVIAMLKIFLFKILIFINKNRHSKCDFACAIRRCVLYLCVCAESHKSQ